MAEVIMTREYLFSLISTKAKRTVWRQYRVAEGNGASKSLVYI